MKIEDIRPGDCVWATDPETGETGLREVKGLFRGETNEWIHVTVNDEEIVCTPDHPFWVPVKGWTKACHLRAGDRLQLLNGEYVVVEQIQHELLEHPEATYNFEVEGYHTYYVGGSGVLVHNRCLSNSEAYDAAKKLGYTKVKGATSHGKAVFINKNAPRELLYITPDVDQHSGGVWKAAKTIKGLATKATRSGTYDINLNWMAL